MSHPEDKIVVSKTTPKKEKKLLTIWNRNGSLANLSNFDYIYIFIEFSGQYSIIVGDVGTDSVSFG